MLEQLNELGFKPVEGDEDEQHPDLMREVGEFTVRVQTHGHQWIVDEWRPLGICDLDYSHAAHEHLPSEECIAWEVGKTRQPVKGHDEWTPLTPPIVELYLPHQCDEWTIAVNHNPDPAVARAFAAAAKRAADLYAQTVALVAGP